MTVSQKWQYETAASRICHQIANWLIDSQTNFTSFHAAAKLNDRLLNFGSLIILQLLMVHVDWCQIIEAATFEVLEYIPLSIFW